MTAPSSPANRPASIHGTAVKVGSAAVLIRGPSGSGKSRLALELILAGRSQQIAATTLVGDDRLLMDTTEHELVVRPAPELAGLIEVRGLGIRRCDFAPDAVVGLVVDLAAADAARLPPPSALSVTISGIRLPRIAVPVGYAPLPLVVAALTTTQG